MSISYIIKHSVSIVCAFYYELVCYTKPQDGNHGDGSCFEHSRVVSTREAVPSISQTGDLLGFSWHYSCLYHSERMVPKANENVYSVLESCGGVLMASELVGDNRNATVTMFQLRLSSLSVQP